MPEPGRIAQTCVRAAAGYCNHEGPLIAGYHLTCHCGGVVCPSCSSTFCGGEGQSRKVMIAIHSDSYGQCLCK